MKRIIYTIIDNHGNIQHQFDSEKQAMQHIAKQNAYWQKRLIIIKSQYDADAKNPIETYECLQVSRKVKSPKCLPIIEFADKDPLCNGKFYADYRLLQLRNVSNPHIYMDFANREEMDEYISTSDIATF